ncbi:hypothetical protein DAPPUDRAFT_232590 [Daphnia pulex]|uniref:Uncharacterized protein n=1 Tax=Daphnia pulex TaxID=6669 RepID=E9FR92_DAPPU|nr:hypothetical protein DAPPUDRAFT_232590 [Daphnia pulex]|eukprot:EFX90236.1 hypothetical protein DAPPUDRAFT_232590 [Daphnia pulex]
MTTQRHAQIMKAVLTSIVVLPMFNHNLSHIYLARAINEFTSDIGYTLRLSIMSKSVEMSLDSR